MSLHANRLAPIVLLVFLCWMVPSNGQIQCNDRLMRSIRAARDKLRDTNDLSIDELVNLQYHTWPADLKDALRSAGDATLRLFIDFALAPLQLEDSPNVSKIKEQYKRYWNVYRFGYQVDGAGYPRAETMRGIEKLYKKLAGTLEESLELEDFVAAKSESLVHLKRMNELVEQGIIETNRGEFERLINFFNRPRYRPLFVHVFPAIKYVNDVEKLKKLFLDKIFLCGFKQIYPKEILITHIDTTAGFLGVF